MPIVARKQMKRKRESENMKEVKNVLTCNLVKELQSSEGVETTIAEPYQNVEVKVNSPAIVLVTID